MIVCSWDRVTCSTFSSEAQRTTARGYFEFEPSNSLSRRSIFRQGNNESRRNKTIGLTIINNGQCFKRMKQVGIMNLEYDTEKSSV